MERGSKPSSSTKIGIREKWRPFIAAPHFYWRIRCWYAEKVFSRWHWANISEFIKYRGEAIGKGTRDRVKNVEMMERNTRFLREQRWERTEAISSIRIAIRFHKASVSEMLVPKIAIPSSPILHEFFYSSRWRRLESND